MVRGRTTEAARASSRGGVVGAGGCIARDGDVCYVSQARHSTLKQILWTKEVRSLCGNDEEEDHLLCRCWNASPLATGIVQTCI